MDLQKEQEINNLIKLVWGSSVQKESFERWAQGFIFSSEETTALQQFNGGPCSVIAPVQGFILKNTLSQYTIDQIKKLPEEEVNKYLINSLTDILVLCAEQYLESISKGQEEDRLSVKNWCVKLINLRADSESNSSPDHNWFHQNLGGFTEFTSVDGVRDWIRDHLTLFKGSYGVLIFLYSTLLTRKVTKDLLSSICGGEEFDSLINMNEGHGEHPLINLMITGNPSAHSFDGTKDLGGMKILGVESRHCLGFIHLQEYDRQLKVGWYLKNPKHPIWICASQTHITVVFSQCKDLIYPDTPAAKAEQVFGWYDKEDNNFITRDQLSDVLDELGLFSDESYIEVMMQELDPDSIGIILYENFFKVFFGGKRFVPPDTFPLFHYNGLVTSNPDGKVQYAKGFATKQIYYSGSAPVRAPNDLTACLQTKWPDIELQWENFAPSLN